MSLRCASTLGRWSKIARRTALGAMILLVCASHVLAGPPPNTFTLPAGQSGSWSVASNWTFGVPNSTSNVGIGSGTAMITGSAAAHELAVGFTSGVNGAVQMTSGSLSIGDFLAVGCYSERDLYAVRRDGQHPFERR